jgi:transposase
VLDIFAMKKPANTLPDDISQLKGIIAKQMLSLQKYEESDVHRREELERHRTDLKHTQDEITKRDAEISQLREVIRLLRHWRFGQKSEKVKKNDGQLSFGVFNEVEDLSVEEKEDEKSISVKGHVRRGKPKRMKIPEHLPREEVVIDLPEEEKFCPEGHELKLIGEDASEQVDIIPAQIKVIRTIRKKYACPVCGDCVKRAPRPATAIPKSMAAPGLLAYIATSKYGDGLPLYRQEHMLGRAGIEIPRSTMASWMIKVEGLLTPLINLLEEELLGSGYVQSDETRVQVLREPGKQAQSQSYMWVRGRSFPGAPPIILFDYDPTRSGEVAKRLFDGYNGYLHADGYGGYNGICARDGVVRVGCFAHVRRKFFEAMKASKKGSGLAGEAIEIIGRLYEVEKSIRDLTKAADIGERLRVRQEKSVPVLQELRRWLDENIGKVPPQSQLGKALSYAHGEWPHLVRFIEDGRLSIDNNFVENAIRPFVVGRKNWLFSDSVAGAKASAAIYSIMVSAKHNGHDEYAYFRHLLEKLPLAKTVEDFEALLPHRLSPQKTLAAQIPPDAVP